MKTLLSYLSDYKRESVLAPLFKLLEAFLDLLVPLVIANMIDKGILANSQWIIIRDGLILLGLAALGFSFSVVAQWFAAKASVGSCTKLRQRLFDHIQSLSYTELDSLGSNSLITRLTSDVNMIQTGLNMILRLLLRSPFIVFGAMIMSMFIDIHSSLVFIIAIPILCIVTVLIMMTSIPRFQKVQASLDRVLEITRENLTGVRPIRAFRKEEDEVKEFDEANETLTKRSLVVGRISALLNPAVYILINLATVILIQQGAIQVNFGVLTQGEVVALYNYMAQMIVELVKMSSLMLTINHAIACSNRVSSVLNVVPSMHYPANSLEKGNSYPEAVAFEHVHMQYKADSAESLTNISFYADKGTITGIIGATGSGKTTLINMIPRFYEAKTGSVSIDGINVKDYLKEDLIKKIGIVPQKPVLFAGSVRSNMRMGNREATDEEIWQALVKARAADIIREKPGQLDYQIEQGGRNFSGGQRQRLTIARALVKHPQILILDDSASALDFATEAELRKTVYQLCKEERMTTFIISQRCSSIRHADNILVLDDGAIVGSGTHKELMQRCEIYREIYASQYPDEVRREAAA